jgi:hypothetical protein
VRIARCVAQGSKQYVEFVSGHVQVTCFTSIVDVLHNFPLKARSAKAGACSRDILLPLSKASPQHASPIQHVEGIVKDCERLLRRYPVRAVAMPFPHTTPSDSYLILPLSIQPFDHPSKTAAHPHDR